MTSVPTGAGVTVNKKWRGRTPLTLDNLPFGAYVVRVVQPGYLVARDEFTLSSASGVSHLDGTNSSGAVGPAARSRRRHRRRPRRPTVRSTWIHGRAAPP